MDGEYRCELLLSNEYQDSCSQEDDEEYCNTLLKTTEFQDALIWDIEDLVETMNKLSI
jgi:hypothetical protein